MKVAVMQPYFFPYIGYWQLHYFADIWVILDEVQFKQFSWMRRNRILHQDVREQYQYISLPVLKHGQKTPINRVKINNDRPWRDEVMRQLAVYEKFNTVNYSDVTRLVKEIIDRDNRSLTELMMNTFDGVNQYLGLKTECRVSSNLDFERSDITAPDEWALFITKALGGAHYINPPGGREIYDRSKFESRNVKLSFLVPELREYSQNRDNFVPGLSIIDVLMFNGVTGVRRMLANEFEIE